MVGQLGSTVGSSRSLVRSDLCGSCFRRRYCFHILGWWNPSAILVGYKPLCHRRTVFHLSRRSRCHSWKSANEVDSLDVIDWLVLAYSVEKLWFASGAKIHEEFDSILRAIASNG